jgi:enoyl-CoA hydratase
VIDREDVDGVAVLRLSHGKVNALDLELLRAITATFTALDDSDSDGSRAVVLTGAGRSFSAGVDLWRIVEGGPAYVRAFLPALSDAFLAVFRLGKPVVAAVNGHAIAGGAILACACDHRLMADADGRVGVTELAVGVPFPLTALEILASAMGAQRARAAIVAADTHPPREALIRGYVDELTAPEGLTEAAIARARRLADRVPADTYRLTKAQLRLAAEDRLARLSPQYDPPVEELWVRRVEDGWIRRYMERVTARRSRAD